MGCTANSNAATNAEVLLAVSPEDRLQQQVQAAK